MPAPGIGSATHAVWTASLVHPLPSDRTTLLVTSAVFVVLIGLPVFTWETTGPAMYWVSI